MPCSQRSLLYSLSSNWLFSSLGYHSSSLDIHSDITQWLNASQAPVALLVPGWVFETLRLFLHEPGCLTGLWTSRGQESPSHLSSYQLPFSLLSAKHVKSKGLNTPGTGSNLNSATVLTARLWENIIFLSLGFITSKQLDYPCHVIVVNHSVKDRVLCKCKGWRGRYCWCLTVTI